MDVVMGIPEFLSLELSRMKCPISPMQEVNDPKSRVSTSDMNASSYQSLAPFNVQIYNTPVLSHTPKAIF